MAVMSQNDLRHCLLACFEHALQTGKRMCYNGNKQDLILNSLALLVNLACICYCFPGWAAAAGFAGSMALQYWILASGLAKGGFSVVWSVLYGMMVAYLLHRARNAEDNHAKAPARHSLNKWAGGAAWLISTLLLYACSGGLGMGSYKNNVGRGLQIHGYFIAMGYVYGLGVLLLSMWRAGCPPLKAEDTQAATGSLPVDPHNIPEHQDS